MMEHKVFGIITIPSLGLGTWRMGGVTSPEVNQKEECIQAIRTAIGLGIRHIDTAEYYADGFTETIVGEAIQPYNRKDLFITTKVWQTHLTYDQTLKACNTSLKRLGIDYIDLYLIHRPGPDMDLAGTMHALEELQTNGRVRAIGVSNFSLEQIQEAQRYLRTTRITAVQNEYNLFTRDDALLMYCVKNDIAFVAYRPIIKLATHSPPFLDVLMEKYNKTKVQIVLNWLTAKKNIVTIPKAVQPQHLHDIAGSLGWKMSLEDYNLLDNYRVGGS